MVDKLAIIDQMQNEKVLHPDTSSGFLIKNYMALDNQRARVNFEKMNEGKIIS